MEFNVGTNQGDHSSMELGKRLIPSVMEVDTVVHCSQYDHQVLIACGMCDVICMVRRAHSIAPSYRDRAPSPALGSRLPTNRGVSLVLVDERRESTSLLFVQGARLTSPLESSPRMPRGRRYSR